MTWDPTQYLKFADHRLRPALDLLARIDLDAPRVIFDLGCGAGNVTALLAERWPEARVVGVDSSLEMLARAKGAHPEIEWVRADLADWAPEGPCDLIFSNAALHWLDDHESLFKRLFGYLGPGGALAAQMPRNHQAPSHRCLAETAASGPWAEALREILRPAPVAEPTVYHALLCGLGAADPDIWETEYLHALTGANPVLEWTRGTALRPLLDALPPDQAEGFLAAYAARVAHAYPRRADGVTPFPFRRLFMVARNSASAAGCAARR